MALKILNGRLFATDHNTGLPWAITLLCLHLKHLKPHGRRQPDVIDMKTSVIYTFFSLNFSLSCLTQMYFWYLLRKAKFDTKPIFWRNNARISPTLNGVQGKANPFTAVIISTKYAMIQPQIYSCYVRSNELVGSFW